MMILPERSCASESAETPRLSRTLAFALEICAEEFFDPDSRVVADLRAGHGDEIDSSLSIERPNFSFDDAEQIEVVMASDDDDDDLQWANTKPAFKLPPRRSGSRRSRGSWRTRNISRKEKAMVSQKPVSSANLIAHHQLSGLISAHSVPFSSPFTPRKTKRFHGRRGRGPSILPVNFPRRKGAAGNGGDPMSPDVTCLGRIRSKNLDSIRAPRTICADLWMDQKVRCFETKNQLCGKVCKGGKKTRGRFVPVEAKSRSVEVARTRRERAANFARSLPDMLQGMRKSEDCSSYEPSVPPPNSLLLMRGCRALDKDSGTDLLPVTENVEPSQPSEPAMPPPNSLLLTRGCRVRGNFFSPLELLNNTVPLKSEHEEACTVPLPTSEDFHPKKRKTGASGHLSLLDLIEKEQRATDEDDEDVPTSELFNHTAVEDAGTSHAGQAIAIVNKLSEQKAVELPQSRPTLYQRRSFAELSPVEVSWCKKTDK